MWRRAGEVVGDLAHTAVGAIRATTRVKAQPAAKVVAEVAPRLLAEVSEVVATTRSPRSPPLGGRTKETAPRSKTPRVEPPPINPTRTNAGGMGILTSARQGGAPVLPIQRSRFTAGLEHASAMAKTYSNSAPSKTKPADPQDARRAQVPLVQESSQPPLSSRLKQEGLSAEAKAALIRDSALRGSIEDAAALAQEGIRSTPLKNQLRLHGYEEKPFPSAEERVLEAHTQYAARNYKYSEKELEIMKARIGIFTEKAVEMRNAADALEKQVAFSSTPPAALAYAQAGSELVSMVRGLAGFTDSGPGWVSARPNLVMPSARQTIPALQTVVRQMGHDLGPAAQAHLVSATGTFIGEPQESPASFSRPPGDWLLGVLTKQFETLQEQSGLIAALGKNHPKINELQKTYGELMRVAWQARMNTVVAYIGNEGAFDASSYASRPYGHQNPSLNVGTVAGGEAVGIAGAQLRIAAQTREASYGLEMVDLLGPKARDMTKEAGLNFDAAASSTGLDFHLDPTFGAELLDTQTELQAQIAEKVEEVRRAIQAVGEAVAGTLAGPEIVQRHVFTVIQQQ